MFEREWHVHVSHRQFAIQQLLRQIQIIDSLSPNFVKPMMPRHSMTLSRHQDKLLQTSATLETLGSTSAVLSDLLEKELRPDSGFVSLHT